jgi:hypothetical protein
MNKAALIEALERWIRKRPGLEPCNYIRDWSDRDGRAAYFSEARSITKDLRHARALLRYIENRPSITAEDIITASRHSFSGRLTIEPLNDGEGFSIDYCVGQYWPTEYRRAVCAVLSSAIWDRIREDLPADTDNKGDAIRAAARRELGHGLAKRFFN